MSLSKHFLALSFVMTFIVSTECSANLIINGSFEDNDVQHGSWKWFASDQVNGWSGSNIEIWNHLGGEEAYHGSQFAELNAHPKPKEAFSIYQDIQTVTGQVYDLSFAYQARHSSVNESFLSELLDVGSPITTELVSLILDDHIADGWSVHNASFVAKSAFSRLQFTSIFPSINTQGNFLDDVKITARVYEPSSLALVCIGLLALVLTRRQIN